MCAAVRPGPWDRTVRGDAGGRHPQGSSYLNKVATSERGEKIGALFQPLRLALTGLPGGPDLFEVMGLIGPERSLARIASAADRLAGLILRRAPETSQGPTIQVMPPVSTCPVVINRPAAARP